MTGAATTARTFVCPLCGKGSADPRDAEHCYCGACHVFTGDVVWTDYGLRLKVSECGRYFVGVMRMGYNWRLVTSPMRAEWWPERFWCYAGTGPSSLVAAALAGLAWSGCDDSEPLGWNKDGQTGEWRPPEGT